MNIKRQRTTFPKNLFSLFLTVILLFSLGLHTIQIAHDHFETSHKTTHHHHGEKEANKSALDVVMHLSDKKIFILGLIAILIAAIFLNRRDIFVVLLNTMVHTVEIIRTRYQNLIRVYAYLTVFLRKGIIHSKAF